MGRSLSISRHEILLLVAGITYAVGALDFDSALMKLPSLATRMAAWTAIELGSVVRLLLSVSLSSLVGSTLGSLLRMELWKAPGAVAAGTVLGAREEVPLVRDEASVLSSDEVAEIG
jgi:hypothetical protein